jgi:hypothetical protein
LEFIILWVLIFRSKISYEPRYFFDSLHIRAERILHSNNSEFDNSRNVLFNL